MLLHEELLNTNEYHGKRSVTDLNKIIVIGDKVELLDDMCGFSIISTGGKRKIFFDVEVNIYRLLEILPPLEFQKDAGNWMLVRRYSNTHSEPPLRASTREEIIPKRAEYLDEGNERYSWKLAAAVQAWLEAPKYLKDNTPKKAIEAAMDAWEENDSCQFKGKFAQHSKSKITEVANWAYAGGRPKGSRNKKGKT